MADWHQGMRRADLIAHGDELNAEIDRLARENTALRAEAAHRRSIPAVAELEALLAKRPASPEFQEQMHRELNDDLVREAWAERDEARTRAAKLKEALDAVAQALHLHWPKDARKTYLPDQLAGKVNTLQRERDEAQALIDALRVELVERDATIAELSSTLKQTRIHAWVHRVFANDTCKSIDERCLRVVEEVVELAQACGVDERVVHRVVDYVYQRPAGEPSQEIAGAMVTLYAAAAALGIDADRAFEAEYERICRPEVIAKIQRRQAEKREALVAVPEASTPTTASHPGCAKESTEPSEKVAR